MRGGNVIEYVIKAWDKTKEGLSSALSRLKWWKAESKKTVEEAEKDGKKLDDEVGRLAASAGRLPGIFGKVQSAIGHMGLKAAAVIGALKLGWEAGGLLWEKVFVKVNKIKDPIEELKKKNRELRQEWERAFKAFEEKMETWEEHWDAEIRNTDRAREHVEDLAEAYLKMHTAREKIISAKDDATIIGMQRDKFDAMAGAESPEEATALGKHHDILIAEERAKQELAKHDREAEASAKRLLATEKEMELAYEKRNQLQFKLWDLNDKIAYAESDASVDDLGWEGSNRLEKRLKRAQAQLRRELERAERAEERKLDDWKAADEARKAEDLERKNIEERARLEIDEKKKAYSDYIAEVARKDQEAAERYEQEVAAYEERLREKEERERERAAKEEERERERAEARLHQQRVRYAREELNARAAEERDAQGRLADARRAVARAWGWYRDKDSMAAQLREEKAASEAEKQYAKDFENLKRWRSDWRTAKNLSVDEEAVRRVALAKEEEKAAEGYARLTAEYTQRTAEAVEELLAAAEGEE